VARLGDARLQGGDPEQAVRILSLDVGDVRIGVAVSDPTGTIATPVTTFRRSSRQKDQETVSDLVRQHDAGLVIIGLPRSLSGDIGPQAQRVMRFGDSLAATLPVPVAYWNEAYSTLDAEDIVADRGGMRRRSRRDRARIDEVAAAVILQSYLRSGQRGGSETQ
jgi:putative holliday junction resolvase